MGLVIPDLLKAERRKRGWSQDAVASGINTGQSRYSEWETGVSEPRLGALRRLADLYGMDLVIEFREKART